MDIIKRNTDYSLRLIAALAAEKQGSLSAGKLAKECSVSHQLTSKLLQKLASVGIVKSTLGPSGGYRLAREPEEISISDVVETIQGRININACFGEKHRCPLRNKCPFRGKLEELQKEIDSYFAGTTLADMTETDHS
ncbi:HTH-type transcriptional repressor NsrR [Limihaloglobus sulfuriphilus]|uniref:HTH-type transcriptional repressor NsrR n=1 Tax=Limihaloglobus sulfuriphilus TaxID=1851148 RepID=A0A1Q2MFI3_9BACT|nr:Rrf2 family transcriptional regulator [Limihaloglobus sulfuriphilus]AQQ71456.1 HTH-type transcriptional repressor NsrR [Limihaloglobus sulfuriphilus]